MTYYLIGKGDPPPEEETLQADNQILGDYMLSDSDSDEADLDPDDSHKDVEALPAESDSTPRVTPSIAIVDTSAE